MPLQRTSLRLMKPKKKNKYDKQFNPPRSVLRPIFADFDYLYWRNYSIQGKQKEQWQLKISEPLTNWQPRHTMYL